jgi:hypothetical protein
MEFRGAKGAPVSTLGAIVWCWRAPLTAYRRYIFCGGHALCGASLILAQQENSSTADKVICHGSLIQFKWMDLSIWIDS